ncbi:MAG: hypothetical protein HY812_09555 [Planctomycetes bacterium]|nr:hypothetical protein [Planctomycetota bacterium]
MVDQFEKKGFVVVGVTNVGDKEPEDKTKEFIESNGMRAVVALEPGLASMDAYGFKGFPSAALVSPKGKIVWTGHPAGLEAGVIEENLKDVQPGRPSGDLVVELALPEKYSATAKKLKSGSLGYALNELVKAGSDKKLSPKDAARIDEARREIEAIIERETRRAEEALAEKRYFDAQFAWSRLLKAFRGHDASKSAAEQLAKLKADPAITREISAGERINTALDQIDEGKTDAALKTLRSVTTGPLGDTEEARRAEALAAKLESGG